MPDTRNRPKRRLFSCPPVLPKAPHSATTCHWLCPTCLQPTSQGLTASYSHQLWENNQRKQTEEEPGAPATPDEIPGPRDKWSKDKHVVIQAQMAFYQTAQLQPGSRKPVGLFCPWGPHTVRPKLNPQEKNLQSNWCKFRGCSRLLCKRCC